LNEEIRNKKKEADDEKEFIRENERRQKRIEVIGKGEVPEKMDESDIFLQKQR
jgi:hypothetical protein